MAFKRSQKVKPASSTGPAHPVGIAVRIFTPDYVLGGYVTPPGQAFLGWINNVNQRAIVLTRAQAMGLPPDSAVQSFSPSEVSLPKNRIVAIDLLGEVGRHSIQLVPRRVRAALYAGGFLIRANLHPTGDMPVSNLFNVMSSEFFAVSEAEIRSTLPTRDFGPDKADVLLVNHRWVDFFHAL
jgi:hypothetical protein